MDLDIPKWLDKHFIEESLQGGKEVPKQDKITVIDIVVDKPMAKGDNYLCEIFRVNAVYQKTDKENGKEPMKISLIVKSPITGGLHDLLKTLGVLQKEVRYYNEYVPRMDKILRDKTICPKSYYSSQENVVVLEDLKASGYVMANRRLQLDYDHCVTALRILAKLHASSVKLHEEDPELVEGVGKEVFYREDFKTTNDAFGKNTFLLLAEECKNNPELNRYAEQLSGYGENSWEILLENTRPKENSFNVFNHGDFWVNNMLFRYENDKPVDLKIIDLQISRYTTPAIDLFYFLYTSVQEEVRTQRIDDLLNVYLTHLNLYLEEFGTKQRLSQAELQNTMNECEFFGILVTVSLFPLIISDPNEGVLEIKELSVDSVNNLENNPFKRYYKNKACMEIIKKRLVEFEKKGWF